MSTPYTPWLGSPEHAEAEQVHTLLLSVSDEAAMDAYNAMKASYLDKAEAEIERLTARKNQAPSLEYSDMLNRLVAAQQPITPGMSGEELHLQDRIALAMDLLQMDGEQVELDHWPAAQAHITSTIHSLPEE